MISCAIILLGHSLKTPLRLLGNIALVFIRIANSLLVAWNCSVGLIQCGSDVRQNRNEGWQETLKWWKNRNTFARFNRQQPCVANPSRWLMTVSVGKQCDRGEWTQKWVKVIAQKVRHSHTQQARWLVFKVLFYGVAFASGLLCFRTVVDWCQEQGCKMSWHYAVFGVRTVWLSWYFTTLAAIFI